MRVGSAEVDLAQADLLSHRQLNMAVAVTPVEVYVPLAARFGGHQSMASRWMGGRVALRFFWSRDSTYMVPTDSRMSRLEGWKSDYFCFLSATGKFCQ